MVALFFQNFQAKIRVFVLMPVKRAQSHARDFARLRRPLRCRLVEGSEQRRFFIFLVFHKFSSKKKPAKCSRFILNFFASLPAFRRIFSIGYFIFKKMGAVPAL
jgi:hypothetical protein